MSRLTLDLAHGFSYNIPGDTKNNDLSLLATLVIARVNLEEFLKISSIANQITDLSTMSEQ